MNPTLSGNVISIDLSGSQLSGSIPSSIGSFSKLEKLDLSSNQLSGSIPPSIGNLSQLNVLDLSNNKELSGAIPSIVSKCAINTNGTGISQVQVKTKPLNNALDYLFVIFHVALGYIDLVFDILVIIALSRTNIPIMIANLIPNIECSAGDMDVER